MSASARESAKTSRYTLLYICHIARWIVDRISCHRRFVDRARQVFGRRSGKAEGGRASHLTSHRRGKKSRSAGDGTVVLYALTVGALICVVVFLYYHVVQLLE